jgi:hypothetical protein
MRLRGSAKLWQMLKKVTELMDPRYYFGDHIHKAIKRGSPRA